MAEQPAPEQSGSFSFVEAEHAVLDFWAREEIFEKSLEQTKDAQPYIFYDGPPFATGLPHHGHIVASTIKDIVPRYWTMQGRYVMRRFGWDCHGLPIEHEIDKSLNMSAQDAVEDLGIKGYNDQCRAIVQRYTSQWRETITRLGRWVDFDHDYKTMDAWYMESVWWVLKQLWDKGYVYEGVKVMPISTALATPLSNFEATSNYMDVQDPAVTVLFKLDDEDAYLAAWTTTPWTLPSNLAVCVGPEIEYAKAFDESLGAHIYVAAERLSEYPELKDGPHCLGKALVGRSYQPAFDYFAGERANGAFVVVSDGYVTTESGTGLVHQAPAFGEDDHRVLQAHGIEAFVCPVTLEGLFTDEVSDFVGQHVKDADKNIIRALKDKGVLYRQDTLQHSYPFCYRSDTPLIYRAIPSWYVRVTEIKERLLAANGQILWVPDHLKEGRFGNWLENSIDWAISRNRVWGTPIPIWRNDKTGNTLCIGSIEELEQYSGVRLEDLHRENVDPLTFSLDGEEGTYERIPEVLDCWFESGSMPYAQLHYPFENKEVFEAGFPAEFIAEGLDQTRGWFYTLTVLAAALFDKPAFRNVIVNGMVLAEDGKKMSKRLRNYTPPDALMEQFGADALRLYLITSGLVRGEEQRFADSGVRDMVRRAQLPWYNAFSFLHTYAQIDGWAPGVDASVSANVLDRWILARLQTLKANIAREMAGYRLFAVVPQLFDFIEDLTNWYIRLNRSRFWAAGLGDDKQAAYGTLFTVLQELSLVMAPFAPFLSEHLYLELAAFGGKQAQPQSVHLCRYPAADESLMDAELEQAVDRMQQVILLGRQKREAEKINLRTPLAAMTIVQNDADALRGLSILESYIAAELNVQSVAYDADESAYIEVNAKPNFPVLGKRLGKRMKEFQKLINALDAEAIAQLRQTGAVDIGGERFTTDEIAVVQVPREGADIVTNSAIGVALDCTLTPDLIRGGYAREAVRRIQRTRQDSGLRVSDRIKLGYHCEGDLALALTEHAQLIAGEVLAVAIEFDPEAKDHEVEIDGHMLRFSIQVA